MSTLTAPPQTPMTSQTPPSLHTLPDAEAQCTALAAQLRPLLALNPALVGIYSGGVWIAERLRELLGLSDDIGVIDVSFYRDDFAERGLHGDVRPSAIPFAVEGRHLILIDDVLYTGRTTRAAINELFDYGRPASVKLAVLADRGGRELPMSADFCVWQAPLATEQSLVLAKDEASGQLAWRLENV